MKREEDLETCLTAATPRHALNHRCERKKHKTQNKQTPSTQTVGNCPRLHPSHLFICHFHADEISLSVCPICCIIFPLQTISDSFSQLTQMASINFSIKIRIYNSEQFNKPPRDRRGPTRISRCIVGYAESIFSLSVHHLCRCIKLPRRRTPGCFWCEKQKICIKRCRRVFGLVF